MWRHSLFAIKLLLGVFVFLACLSTVAGFGNNYWKLRQRHGRQKQEKVQKLINLKNPDYIFNSPSVEHFIEQPLDHFDPRVKLTYQQRYWVNEEYWKQPNGPVFLLIGGEGGLSFLEVIEGEHVELAKKFGALIIAVEHRFYGASINNNGLRLEQMQYLSSQQALADLASVHAFISKRYNLSVKNTWICFGGSYPGALSAWFRLKYPHLVYGAVASSAPVRAKVDFEGYNDVVAASLGDPIVNGSQKCVDNVRAAFKKVDAMIANKELETLAADFLSCVSMKSSHDVYQFVSNLADVFMTTVQYNDESPGLTVDKICRNMTQVTDPYKALLKLNTIMLKESGQNCSDNSWDSFMRQLTNTTVTKGDNALGMRQWIYQTCTQFGYYQTCEANTSCIFSKHLSLQPNLDLCDAAFGMSAHEVYARAAFSNDYYGADHPKGTRIIFVNGSIDPWHALSVLRDLSGTERAVYIKGTAHCANMQPSSPSDTDSLRRARAEIEYQIDWWLIDAQKEVADKDTMYFRPSR